MNLGAYIVRRLLMSALILLIVSVVVFGIVHFTPGDPARIILGDMATQVEVERLRTELGLDRPLLIQYIDWLSNVVRGDLGNSLFLNRSVLTAIIERAEPTILLMVLALTFATLLGVPAGIMSALKRNSIWDQGFAIVALLGVSTPNFWFGLILILFVSAELGWLPSGGFQPIAQAGLWASLKYLILPAITLGFAESALISRVTRSTMLEVLSEDYVRTARSKGLRESLIVGKHALRNALIPILTVVGLALAQMLGGAVVTETVFTLPGVGRLVISSVGRRDYPVIQGVILVVAAIYVLVNLLIDLLYVIVDPRVKY